MHTDSTSRIILDRALSPERRRAQFVEDVRRGLSERPKYLLPKYFYDERGCQLFSEICDLPEYYLTRVELNLLRQLVVPLVLEFRPRTLVELGAGSGPKTRLLLDAIAHDGSPRLYVPIDVSEEATREIADRLVANHPNLRVHGVIDDFGNTLQLPLAIADGMAPRLFAFLGSTIGNFTPPEALSLLAQTARWMGPSDRFLVGVDLVKDVKLLEAAYNDAAGVTAEFNLNLLRVINRELGADFDLESFEHHAFYNAVESRIEMHLRSRTAQQVTITQADLTISCEQGETIRTEISCKYTADKMTAMLREAGLEPVRWETDAAGWFGLSVSRRAG